MSIKSFFNLKPKNMDGTSWEIKDTQNDSMANLIKDCLLYKKEILDRGPHLPFPQHACCYTYQLVEDPGKSISLPIGLLYHLWDNAGEFTGRCPSCGGRIYGYAYGGHLSTGGIVGICIDCSRDAFQFIGGLAKVGDLVRKYLPGTPYKGHSMWFGGAAPNAGKALKYMLMNARYMNAR
jgi:hypothetical protein